jgi:hypothetical protein
MYRGGGRSIQFETDPMTMVNIGSSLNILKGKGTISFRVNDIFEGMKFKFKSTNPYPSTGQFNWESQTAYLGFSYRFGGGENRVLKRKNIDGIIKLISKEERKKVWNMGIKIGRYHIFLPKMLKPKAVTLRTMLWKIYNDVTSNVNMPKFGLNFVVNENFNEKFFNKNFDFGT